MVESSIKGPGSRYDRWDLEFDLATNTFSADYYNFGLNQATTLVANGAMLQ